MTSAKYKVTVNGGAPTFGGTDVPSAAVIAFVPDSTVGWRQQRWEIYEYPEGFVTPTNWTLGADGVIYSTSVTPDPITLPASSSLWGPWSTRCKVNEAVDDDKIVAGDLIDDRTILHMASPLGLRMPAALETTQFCTATTKHKGWVRTIQRALKIIETLIGSGTGPITDTQIDWQPTAAPATRAPARLEDADTTDATETTADSYALVDEGTYDINVTLMGRSTADDQFAIDDRLTVSVTDGTVTTLRASSPTNALAGNPVGWLGKLDVSAGSLPASVRARVKGAVGKTVKWSSLMSVQRLDLNATAVPPAPAIWGGVTPVADWNAATVTHSNHGGTERVDTIPDGSGASHPATPVAGKEPRYNATDALLNNQPSIGFPVADGQPGATFGSLGIAANGAFTILIVGYAAGSLNNRYYIDAANNGATVDLNIYTENIGGNVVGTSGTSGSPLLTSTKDSSTAHAIMLSRGSGAGATQKLFIDDGATAGIIDSDTSASCDFSAGGMIGKNHTFPGSDGFVLGGAIARIIVWNVELTEGQRVAAINEATTLYGTP